MNRIFASLFLISATWLIAPLAASAVTIDFVPVANPGNAADTVVMTDGTTGYGSVPYSYNIDKYDVTISQYTEFLNAKDPTGANALGLYNFNMSDATFGGISLTAGNANGSKYSAISGRGNHPANFTSWYDAIRFANWLNNGQGNGDTETGAYTLGPIGPGGVPTNGNTITRNNGATVFLPSENEWYKAAYSNPAINSYSQYPTGSDAAPTAEPPPGGSNSANYNSVVQDLTNVGAYTGTTSPYGAFDMGGNVFQWNEALISGSLRGLRGGSFLDGSDFLLSSNRRLHGDPTEEDGVIGFRVASIPVVTLVATWTGANSTNWADAGNWSGTVPAGAIASTTNTDTALFNQNAMNSTLTIDAGRNLQNITFDTAKVNSLTIGTFGGPALLLTAGGTIQTTSTVVNPQNFDAPLVLAGDYTFTSGASSSSATLFFGGGITPAATSGVTTLTLNGSNTSANAIRGLADNGSGQLAVTMSGTGVWILGVANTYSGGTTINSGTLVTTSSGALGVGPLTINAADNIASVLNLGSDAIISDVTINKTGTGPAIVIVAAGATLTSTGALTTTGTFISVGPGTLEIDGAPTLNDNSHLKLTGGTLRFSANSGTATIGTGVTVTIATDATLELAGSVAALSSISGRVNVINNSNPPGILVSGTNQQVGAIDGTGDTLVNAGSDLTANHIIQSALMIGGTSKNPGLVTIDASDSNGNSLANGILLASSLQPSGPFGAGVSSVSSIGDSANLGSDAAVSALDSSSAGASGAAVPEPSALMLLVLSALTLSLLAIVRGRTHFTESQQ